jgi:hypothetical protein
MTYLQICTWSHTTGATNKTLTAYSFGAHEYTPEFLVGFVLHDLSWLIISDMIMSSITYVNILETCKQMNRICTGKMHAYRKIVSLQSQEFLNRPVCSASIDGKF